MKKIYVMFTLLLAIGCDNGGRVRNPDGGFLSGNRDRLAGESCDVDTDCVDNTLMCDSNVCRYRIIGSPCQRYTNGSEQLCSYLADGVQHIVYPLDTNEVPHQWLWCLYYEEVGYSSCRPAAVTTLTCRRNSDCVGHYANAACTNGVCRTLYCNSVADCFDGETCNDQSTCVR